MAPLNIERRKVADLSLDPANVRLHSDANIDAIKASLRRFGQQKPIVVRPDGTVIAGNGTLAAASALGWEDISVVVTELEGADAVAFAIADNRTAELAEWDVDALAKTLAVLDDAVVEDLGFTPDSMNALRTQSVIEDLDGGGASDSPLAPQEEYAEEGELPEKPAAPVVQRGDVWTLGRHTLRCGDSLGILREMESGQVDTVLTDPPYGLEFMGKGWDKVLPDPDIWAEALRVAKPGAMLLAFGGTRTYHRLAVHIEDSGFEIRDCLSWLYGSGFPKSLDVSKAIDKAAGAEREVIGPGRRHGGGVVGAGTSYELLPDVPPETAPATDAAQLWNGWGTALKPAWEPIILARKPLAGTVAANALEHGVAGLNVDGTRIGTDTITTANTKKGFGAGTPRVATEHTEYTERTGRWPANLVLDDEAGAMLDEQSGESVSTASMRGELHGNVYGGGKGPSGPDSFRGHNDSGGASRFFYCAKVSTAERGDGNRHPTVKPLALMRWLATLTATPTGGTVLEPFSGSGSTLLACEQTGRTCLASELDPAHVEVAIRRWEALTGETATREDGKTLRDLREEEKA